MNSFEYLKLTGPPKESIINAAAHVSILDNRPFNFCENKRGMTLFAEALLQVGQSVPSGRHVDVKDALPCGATVAKAVKKIASNKRDVIKSTIQQALKLGGGITCDGVKCEYTGRKFYDFVLHYIELPSGNFKNNDEWKMKSVVLFVAQHEGAENAKNIRSTLAKKLRVKFNLDVDVFFRRFSFTTDCAAVMPRVFDASVSANQVPFSERWIGCINHQLNTAMKHVMESNELKNSIFTQSVEKVKKIITLVKQSGLNTLLPDGSSLKQEVETRFGSTCDTIERFVHSFNDLVSVVENNSSEATSKISTLIDDLLSINKSTSDEYQASSEPDQLQTLTAAVDVFRPIRHAQTILEGNVCTIIQVLPVLERLKHNLKVMANEFSNSASNTHNVQISNIALREIQSIPYYDLWSAACIVCPGLNTFSFMNPVDARQCREKGTNLVRKLISEARRSSEEVRSVPVSSTTTANTSELIVTPKLGKD